MPIARNPLAHVRPGIERVETVLLWGGVLLLLLPAFFLPALLLPSPFRLAVVMVRKVVLVLLPTRCV